MARRYSRDNRGRFASGGTGATARGGRLKTASGNKRATQTTKATAAKPSGAIAGKVKRNPAAAGKIGQQAATTIASAPKPQRVSARATGTSAPNTPRTQANRLRTAQGAIRQLQRTGATPDSKAFRTAVQRRDAALGARAQGTPGKMTFRSRGKSVARQNYQANQVTGRVAANMRYAKPGDFKAQTGSANKTGIKRSDTGMRQSSLFGAPAKLYSAKKVKVDRKSGKRR